MKRRIEVNERNFESELLKSTLPVVADFGEPWCGPGKMMAPVLEELATEQAGQVKIAKLNIDEKRNLAARFGIQTIPTLLYFFQGRLRHHAQSLASKKGLISHLSSLAPTA